MRIPQLFYSRLRTLVGNQRKDQCTVASPKWGFTGSLYKIVFNIAYDYLVLLNLNMPLFLTCTFTQLKYNPL